MRRTAADCSDKKAGDSVCFFLCADRHHFASAFYADGE